MQKNKLNLRICGIHLLNPYKTVVSHLKCAHSISPAKVSGFIAQLVRASNRYREVTGSNPVEVLTFSGFYTQFNYLIAFITGMIIAYLISNPQLNI